MVNTLKKDLLQRPAGKDSKSTKKFTRRHYQANNGKSDLEPEKFQVLGALHSLRSKKMLSAEKRWEKYFLSKKANAKWIEDYVDSKTAVARKGVQDLVNAIMQEQKHMRC
jgi:hypothetical protein